MIIEDDGRGFDPSAVNGDGRGLGVTTMKERAALIHGVCEIESKPGQGTRVHVRVPLIAAGDRPSPAALSKKRGDSMEDNTTGETIRVVIVDDHGIVRQGLRALLTRPGIEVIGEADSGIAAVELAKTLQPDVMLLDIRMKEGDGLAGAAADQGGFAAHQRDHADDLRQSRLSGAGDQRRRCRVSLEGDRPGADRAGGSRRRQRRRTD